MSVEDEEIVRRLGQRWTCPNPACGAVYNAAKPSRPGKKASAICAKASSTSREDDKPATIRSRLQLFHKLHDAILHHYQNQGF